MTARSRVKVLVRRHLRRIGSNPKIVLNLVAIGLIAILELPALGWFQAFGPSVG